MNKQNFEEKDRFPLSTQALSFMQDMILASAQLALIGGNRYILSGCETTGNNVAPGIIVVDGEILPFDGGVKVDTITIVQTATSVSANNVTFENARVTRKAIFATGPGANYLPWSDFKPLKTNKQLEEAKATIQYVDGEIAKIQAGSIPTGVIVMWGGREADIPEGWTLCDGKELPDGKRVPDLRGRFIVGYNSTTQSGYTTIGAGEKMPDAYNISLQIDHMPAHNHEFDDYFRFDDPGEEFPGTSDGTVACEEGSKVKNDGSKANVLYYKTHTTETTGSGQPFDIRPPYYVLAFIIKI